MSDGGQADQEGGAPSSMIVQFATLEGENKGPQIDVPLGSTVLQMEELMNQLLENKDKVRERSLRHVARRFSRELCSPGLKQEDHTLNMQQVVYRTYAADQYPRP